MLRRIKLNIDVRSLSAVRGHSPPPLYVIALVLNMLPSRWAIIGTLGLLAAGLFNTAGELIGQPVAYKILGLG